MKAEGVWWQGKQWQVTEYGLETLDGSYIIDRESLTDYRPGRDGISDWLCHMAEKDWVDVDDFSTAFVIALAMHAKGDRLLPEDLLNTVIWMRSYREHETKFTEALHASQASAKNPKALPGANAGSPFRFFWHDDLEAAGEAVGDAPEPPRSVLERP